jgi:hypothetical protein
MTDGRRRDGRRTKSDHKSSPCHFVTGELKIKANGFERLGLNKVQPKPLGHLKSFYTDTMVTSPKTLCFMMSTIEGNYSNFLWKWSFSRLVYIYYNISILVIKQIIILFMSCYSKS